MYGVWSYRGLIAYAAGFVAEIPFMVLLNLVTLKSYYTGPLASDLNSVDISWIVGAVVTAVVCLLLTRNLDVAAEQAAIDASEAELRRITRPPAPEPGRSTDGIAAGKWRARPAPSRAASARPAERGGDPPGGRDPPRGWKGPGGDAFRLGDLTRAAEERDRLVRPRAGRPARGFSWSCWTRGST